MEPGGWNEKSERRVYLAKIGLQPLAIHRDLGGTLRAEGAELFVIFANCVMPYLLRQTILPFLLNWSLSCTIAVAPFSSCALTDGRSRYTPYSNISHIYPLLRDL
jgi:hypothetical protein